MLQTHQHHKHDIEFPISITWISDGDLKMAFAAMSVCETENKVAMPLTLIFNKA